MADLDLDRMDKPALIAALREARADALRKGMEAIQARTARQAAEADAAKMRAIFRWLLGEEGDFPERQPGQGAYYWRSHLRKKLDALAALEPTP